MFVLLFIIFVIALYFYTTKNHYYWAKRKVKHDAPVPLFGNHFRNIFGKKSIIEISTEYYSKYPKEKVVGYYRGSTPELIVCDLDIAKTILNVDFAYFYPRGLGRNTKTEPMLRNLFHADGDLWKLLRQRITPAFTTAKLKGMFPLVVNCTKKLQTLGENIIKSGGECDVRELMARFTSEFIGACGFGIEVDTINNANSQFRTLGKNAFTRTKKELIFLGLWELFPELRSFIRVLDKRLDKSITAIVKAVCDQKNYKPSNRNDFIDLLLELQSKGTIKGDSIEHRTADGTPVPVEMELDFQLLVAQAFVFFVAGFETSSSATSYTLHQLAFHPEIQKKIQNEIDEVLVKHNNELCFDSVAEMTMLSNAFKEAMRLFPSLGVLHRVCAKKYTITELDITIDPGVKIMIPLQAIHTDEKYFENPTEFDPMRFADTNTNVSNFAYLPFGSGPRMCIGARLGEMQSLAGLAAVLHKFSVEPSANTKRTPEVNHTSNTVQSIKDGLPLKLKLRTKVT